VTQRIVQPGKLHQFWWKGVATLPRGVRDIRLYFNQHHYSSALGHVLLCTQHCRPIHSWSLVICRSLQFVEVWPYCEEEEDCVTKGFLWVWDGYGDWNAIPTAVLASGHVTAVPVSAVPGRAHQQTHRCRNGDYRGRGTRPPLPKFCLGDANVSVPPTIATFIAKKYTFPLWLLQISILYILTLKLSNAAAYKQRACQSKWRSSELFTTALAVRVPQNIYSFYFHAQSEEYAIYLHIKRGSIDWWLPKNSNALYGPISSSLSSSCCSQVK